MLVDFGSEILIPLLPPISLLYFNNPSFVVPSKSFSLFFNLLFSFSIYSYEHINCLYFSSRFSNDCFTGTTTSKSLPALIVWTLKAYSKSLAFLEILSTSLPRSLASYSYFLASLSAIAVSVIASSNYFFRFLDSFSISLSLAISSSFASIISCLTLSSPSYAIFLILSSVFTFSRMLRSFITSSNSSSSSLTRIVRSSLNL